MHEAPHSASFAWKFIIRKKEKIRKKDEDESLINKSNNNTNWAGCLFSFIIFHLSLWVFNY